MSINLSKPTTTSIVIWPHKCGRVRPDNSVGKRLFHMGEYAIVLLFLSRHVVQATIVVVTFSAHFRNLLWNFVIGVFFYQNDF